MNLRRSSPSILAVTIATSLLGLVVFGFATMEHNPGHGHAGCLASVAAALPCSSPQTPLDFLSFHLDTVWLVARTTIPAALVLLLLVASAIVWRFVVGRFSRSILAPPPLAFGFPPQLVGVLAVPLRRRLARWLALHERRAPSDYHRVHGAPSATYVAIRRVG